MVGPAYFHGQAFRFQGGSKCSEVVHCWLWRKLEEIQQFHTCWFEQSQNRTGNFRIFHGAPRMFKQPCLVASQGTDHKKYYPELTKIQKATQKDLSMTYFIPFKTPSFSKSSSSWVCKKKTAVIFKIRSSSWICFPSWFSRAWFSRKSSLLAKILHRFSCFAALSGPRHYLKSIFLRYPAKHLDALNWLVQGMTKGIRLGCGQMLLGGFWFLLTKITGLWWFKPWPDFILDR